MMSGPHGSRTVEGLAAMNGEMFRRLGDEHPGKGLRAPFEAAYQNLKKVMGMLRASPKADLNHEKSMTKLKDEFSVFKDLKGNPHDEEDEGVDFDPDEEVQPDNSAKPEAKNDEPEYEDMVDGPLPERGLDAGPKYLGPPRFPWAVVWLSWSSGEAPLCTLALPHHFWAMNDSFCARHVTNNPAKDDNNPNQTWDDVILSG